MTQAQPNLSIPVGDIVRAWRDVRGLTVTELAQRSGMSKGYISQIEHNKIKRPNNNILEKLADALEVTVLDLITRRRPSDIVDASQVSSTNTISDKPARRRRASLASPLIDTLVSRPTTVGEQLDAIVNQRGLSIGQQEILGQVVIPLVQRVVQLMKVGDADE